MADVVFNTVDIISHIIKVGNLIGSHLRHVNKAFRAAMPVDKTKDVVYTHLGLHYSDTYIMDIINMASYSTYALFDWYHTYYPQLNIKFRGDFYRDIELVDKSTLVTYAPLYRTCIGDLLSSDKLILPARFIMTFDVYVINEFVKHGFMLPYGCSIGYLCLLIPDKVKSKYCVDICCAEPLLLFYNLTLSNITSTICGIMCDIPELINNVDMMNHIINIIGSNAYLNNVVQLNNVDLFSLYMDQYNNDYIDDNNFVINTELIELILTSDATDILVYWCELYELFSVPLTPRNVTSAMLKIARRYGLDYNMLETSVIINSILTLDEYTDIAKCFKDIVINNSVLQTDLSIYKLIRSVTHYAQGVYTDIFRKYFMTCGLDLIDKVYDEDCISAGDIMRYLLQRDDINILRAVSRAHTLELSWIFNDAYVIQNNDIATIRDMACIRQNVLLLLLNRINTPITSGVTESLYRVAIRYGNIAILEKIYTLSIASSIHLLTVSILFRDYGNVLSIKWLNHKISISTDYDM